MKTFLRAIIISLVFIILCGLIYPLGMTGISQLFFNKQANGSIAKYNGKPVGSELLGQAFTDMRFFHGRVSANNYNTYTKADKIPDKNGKTAYDGVSSGSANLAPSNPDLAERVENDMDAFLKLHPGVKKDEIPTDLLTSSGSGLDPDISPEAAKIQIPAISQATGISLVQLEKIVVHNTKGRTLGIFGEPRVNVLETNMEIAKLLNITF
ncbi:MAG: K(+)-transporting ATPase subunit C [Bacillota bacterium]|nr:K(+)-transporting ATPase subunit C [Bacillota bacterium]